MSNVVSSLAVEIGANINDLQRGLNRADNEVQGFVGNVQRSMRNLGAAMSIGVTLPLAGIATQAARAAIEWESAFAGVRKTVDGTADDLALLERQLRDLATGTTGSPVAGLENAAVTLAGVAEAAGQLGVSREYLVDFTETMAMLGMATNLTAEEAAFSLAQFANIVKLPLENVGSLGSTVVALGNNLATTERDIVEFAQRLAGAGSSAGLTEANILALGGAMASVGLNAEAGGTAMTMVMSEITKAVAGGGEELEDFARLAGWSADEFAQSWQNEPIAALMDFITGLGELDNSSAIQTLDKLGLDGIRVADTLRRLAGNSELLADAVGLANDAWRENTALLTEAEQRMMTTESQMNMLGNNVNEVAITLGSILLPPINAFISAIIPIIQNIAQLNPALLNMGVAFGAVAAAAGPVMFILGALSAPVAVIGGGIAAAAVAIWTFRDSIRDAVPFLDDMLTGINNLFGLLGDGGGIDASAVEGPAAALAGAAQAFTVEIPEGQTVWDAWQQNYKESFPDWSEFRGLAEEALSAQGLTFTTLPGGGVSLQFPVGVEMTSAGGAENFSDSLSSGFGTAASGAASLSFADKVREAFNETEITGIIDGVMTQFERLSGIGTAISNAWAGTEGQSFAARVRVLINSEDVRAAIDDFIAPLAEIPARLSAALSGAFGGGERGSAEDFSTALAGDFQNATIDLSGVRTWAEQNMNAILSTVVSVAGIVFGGPIGMAIGAAKLIATAINNDFLGISTFLDQSGIRAAIDEAIAGIFGGSGGGGAENFSDQLSGDFQGGSSNPLQGFIDSITNIQMPDVSGILNAINGFLTPIKEAFDGYIENIKPGLDAFVQGIGNFFTEIGQTDTSGFDNIAMVIGAVVGGIATLMARMAELGGNLAGGVLTGIGDALGPLGAAIRDIVSAFSIAAETGDVGAAFQSLIDGVVNLGAAALAIPKGAAEGVIGLLEDLTGLELPTIDEGLAALGEGISGAWTLIQISIDNVLRGLRIFFIDLRLAIMEPLQSLRRDIMAATEGSAVGTVDIAPNLGVDVANLQLERSSFDINDKLQQEINNGLEAGSIDISQSLGPALAVNAEVLASTMGMQQRTAIQSALDMAISQGDQETFDVLLPLATELGMDTDAMQTQMKMSVVTAAAVPVPVNIPVQVTLDPQFTNFAAFQATVDATARAAAGGGPMPGAAPLPPGFRGGTDYVTSDGLYMLHRGERVLTAQENQGGAGNTQIVVNNYGESMHDVLNRIQRAASDRGY